VREPLEQGLRRQQFDAGGGQFNGQGQAIQAHTDFGDGAGIGRREQEAGLDGLGTRHKERGRCIVSELLAVRQLGEVRRGERQHGKLVFAHQMQR
jgi:hypothetical protein